MITPADIEVKEFSRSKRGYDEEEVDLYLDEIIVEMERLIKENQDLKRKLSEKSQETVKTVSADTSVYETLEAAKSLMNDIASSAERRAEVLLKNAELEASLITKEAKDSVSRYIEEGNRLQKNIEALKTRYKRMLQDELDRIDFSAEDLLSEFENDFIPASMPEDTHKTEELAPKANDREVDLTKTMVISR